MDSQEQIEKDVEFGKTLKRGPWYPFIGEGPITNEERYEHFRQRMYSAGVTYQDLEMRIVRGIRAKQRIIAKFRAPVRGNVHGLKLVV